MTAKGMIVCSLISGIERCLIASSDQAYRRMVTGSAIRGVLHSFTNEQIVTCSIPDTFDWGTQIMFGHGVNILGDCIPELAKIAYCAYRDCA